MCSPSLLVAYLVVMSFITSVQGQRNKTTKNNLVIYDPKSETEAVTVNVGTTASNGTTELNLVEVPIYWVPCVFRQLQVNCCIGIRLRDYNIDKKVCIRVTFLLPLLRLQIVILLENRKLLNFSVSILKPITFCIPTFLPLPVFICFKIYDIVLPIGQDFEGCFSLLLKLMTQQIFELKLGCARLGAGGVSFFSTSLIEEFVSSEDERLDILREDNDNISLENNRKIIK